MKNVKMRHILESEILRLRAHKKPLNRDDFDKYCKHLKTLCALELKSVMMQREIYSCAYGDMGEFVREFTRYVTPLLCRAEKEIYFNVVRHSRTLVLFSPRLVEIALGGILIDFLRTNDAIGISVFNTKSAVAICVSSKDFQNPKHVFNCIKHITRLHGGRCIVSFCQNQNKIIMSFPFFPSFQPLKLVPCSTELCRLCHI